MTALIGIVLGLVLVALSVAVSRIRNEGSRAAATCMLCALATLFSVFIMAAGLHDDGKCIVPCEEASE